VCESNLLTIAGKFFQCFWFDQTQFFADIQYDEWYYLLDDERLTTDEAIDDQGEFHKNPVQSPPKTITSDFLVKNRHFLLY